MFYWYLDYLYRCYSLWTKFSLEPRNWITYMVSSWFMWNYLYTLYKCCKCLFDRNIWNRMISIGWNESSNMDACYTDNNNVFRTNFIHYFWYVVLIIFEFFFLYDITRIDWCWWSENSVWNCHEWQSNTISEVC